MRTAMALCVLLLAILTLPAGAGELEPSAPPAPTMKPLDDVESRTPIRAADLPLTITEPGSYYLAESIVTSGDGIAIRAWHVTIDLNGYTLEGGTGDGISTAMVVRNVVVKNGTVANWAGAGIDLSLGLYSQVENVFARENDGFGIKGGASAIVRNCRAESNSVGIRVEADGIVTDSLASYNTAEGIRIGNGSTLHRCLANDNQNGILAPGGWVVIADSIVTHNDVNGIEAFNVSRIERCHATGNLNGIQVMDRCRVVDNLAQGNGIGEEGAGILVLGLKNHIDGNTLNSNHHGIRVEGIGNLIIRNVATDNSPAYEIAGSNNVGPIGSVSASTSPWANLLY